MENIELTQVEKDYKSFIAKHDNLLAVTCDEIGKQKAIIRQAEKRLDRLESQLDNLHTLKIQR
jgi:hypothetical protein